MEWQSNRDLAGSESAGHFYRNPGTNGMAVLKLIPIRWIPSKYLKAVAARDSRNSSLRKVLAALPFLAGKAVNGGWGKFSEFSVLARLVLRMDPSRLCVEVGTQERARSIRCVFMPGRVMSRPVLRISQGAARCVGPRGDDVDVRDAIAV